MLDNISKLELGKSSALKTGEFKFFYMLEDGGDATLNS
jgi:hypothetical protein